MIKRVEHLDRGDTTPSAAYAEQLREALASLCHYRGRFVLRADALEPFWHFVETMAVSRMFGIDTRLYDKVDRFVTCMGRSSLISLALRSFLSVPVEDYFDALMRGEVDYIDAAKCYFGLAATCDWIEDNRASDVRVDTALDETIRIFSAIVDKYHDLIAKVAANVYEVRHFWRVTLERCDDRFVSKRYKDIAYASVSSD